MDSDKMYWSHYETRDTEQQIKKNKSGFKVFKSK